MTEQTRIVSFRVDADGRLVADPSDSRQLGLRPGDALRIETGDPLWVARRPVSNLARVYVEPTNACNLTCSTCVRNVWSAESGFMTEETFDALLRGLAALPRPPVLFFGGFGEPLAHPRILPMLEEARSAGAEVELITNGILLGDEVRRALVSLGLRRLWVSIDGATPAAYRDVRIGDALPEILANLAAFRALREASPGRSTRLGLVFVAMRRNLGQLPDVVKLGRAAGMDRLLVTNVLAYTDDLKDETLYDEGLAPGDGDSLERTAILLPRLEPSGAVREALAAVVDGGPVDLRPRLSAVRGRNFCPFVERGTTSVRWDGTVSPCLALLYDHDYWLGDRRRHSHASAVGNVRDRSLADVWADPAYVELRRRAQAFDFSPCSSCNTCEMADDNSRDCSGSPLPACGGCLWAQGLIQCP
ncbi:MAG TPA: SPASM domain-containing protein [Thermoanaerobaculia bacterium]|nr:SPASM domain-containing protein [Thermoanaerobaculia bacterium]